MMKDRTFLISGGIGDLVRLHGFLQSIVILDSVSRLFSSVYAVIGCVVPIY
jgi:hypothetical protein